MIILGASGLVGRAIYATAKALGLPAIGTSRTGARGLITFNPFRDPLYYLQIPFMQVEEAMRSTHVIIAAGITPIDACAQDPEGTADINVRQTIRLIDDIAAMGYTPVFLSTSYVFSGRGPHAEHDTREPLTTYGQQKLAVERHMEAMPGPWLILRLDKVFSDESPIPSDVFHQHFTPLDAMDAAYWIVAACQHNLTGEYHIAGEPTTRLAYALAQGHQATVYPQAHFGFVDARPTDTRLDSTKIRTALKAREMVR